MSSRSGLTLVEVLAALVLLTIVAATSVPLVHRATEALAEDRQPDVLGLVELADRFAESPKEFGFETLPANGSFTSFERESTEAVRFSVLYPGDSDADHAWVALRCEGTVIFRRIPYDAKSVAHGGEEGR